MENVNNLQYQNRIQETRKKRQVNFELLRLVSMLMVVVLHYLSKGYVLPDFTSGMPTGNQYLAYALESFSIVAVNAFLLVSGYFLIESQFKCRRVIELVGQVLFYTLLIPVLLLLKGVLQPGDMNLYTLGNAVFPIQTEHYWFATYYIFLYLSTPLLNRGIKALDKGKLQIMIVFFLLAFSIPKSVIPVPLAADRKGYDLIWFICVYLIGAYLRLYGVSDLKFLHTRGKSILLYVGASMCIFLYSIGMGIFYLKTGKLQDQLAEALQYNHIFCIVGAVAFFSIFYHIQIKDGGLSRMICKVSPFAFGVYLLHEQIDVRYLWPVWFKVKEFSETGWFLPHFMVTIITIFTVGLVVDFVRSRIFRIMEGIGEKLIPGRIKEFLHHIDETLHMEN